MLKRFIRSKEDNNDRLRLQTLHVADHLLQRAGAVMSVLLSVSLLIGGMVCLLLVSHRSVGLRLGTIISVHLHVCGSSWPSLLVTTVGVEYTVAPSGLVFRGMGQFKVNNVMEVLCIIRPNSLLVQQEHIFCWPRNSISIWLLIS